MAPGPKPITLVLSATERETLLGLLRRRSTSQDVALRARIVLACADPQATNTGIAPAGRQPPERGDLAGSLQRASPGWAERRAPERRAP